MLVFFRLRVRYFLRHHVSIVLHCVWFLFNSCTFWNDGLISRSLHKKPLIYPAAGRAFLHHWEHMRRGGERFAVQTLLASLDWLFSRSVYGSYHFQLWNVSWERVDRNTESSSSRGMGTPELKIVSVLGFAFAGNKMASKRKLDANIVPFDTFSHHFLSQEAKHFLKDSKSLVRPCTKYWI